jgi:hypothetical protein
MAHPDRGPYPRYASGLNQVEVYFSVIQRKVLTPNDFALLDELQDRLHRLHEHYEQVARPFEWKFSRARLEALLLKLTPLKTRSRAA